MNNVARKFGMLFVIGAMTIGVAACETMGDDAMMASDASVAAAEAAAESAARSAAAAQAAAEAAAASAERAERMFQQSMEK